MAQTEQADTKHQVEELLRRLPDDCSFEDIQYHLYVMDKIQKGLDAVDRGEGVSHDEVKRRFAKWRGE